MSDDVLITPASRKIEFFDSGGNIDGKIELSAAGDLNITSNGKITIGDITQDIHIGDGTQAVDLVFDFTSSIYSVANQDLTIGKGSLGGNDVTIDGADAVILSLAGTEQARLTSTGLGIGTTNPASELDLNTGALSFANTNTQLKLTGGSNVDLQLSHWANAHIIVDSDGNDSNRYFSVRHGNTTAGSATELFRVQENGDVGIGITGPTAKLHVDEGSLNAASLTFDAAAGQIFTNENSQFAFGLHNASPYPLYIQGRTHTNGVRQIVLNPLGGNVGVGALDADDAPLHVKHTGNGDTLILESTDAAGTDNDMAPNLVLIRSGTPSQSTNTDAGRIQFKALDFSTSANELLGQIQSEFNTANSSARMRFNVSSSGGSGHNDYEYMRFDGGVRDVVFNESGVDIDVRIEGDSDTALFFTDASSDRVGIGTTSPEAKLEIEQTDGAVHGLKVYRNDDTTSAALVYLHDDHAFTDNAVLHVKTDRADQYGYAAVFEGKVGIGTTIPDQQLHVEGSILADAYNHATTTLASNYTDGETSLVLTDASQFPGAGSGTIDGVEFTWTSVSGNTLTVPDLDASYTAGVTVVADTGLFFRDGFENVAQPSVTIYDKDNSGASRDDLSINANSGIRFRLGNESQMQLTADKLSLTTGNQGAAAIFGFRDRNDMGLKSDASYSVGVLAPDNVFIQTDSNNNGTANYIDFGHGSSAVGSAESMMRIVMGGATGAGKVGIGTTSPAATVDIKTGGSGSRTSFNAVADDLVVDSTGDTGITISSSNTATGNVFFADSDNNARGQIRYDHAGNSMRFSVSGAENMRIASDGDVGIGTTSPDARLEVVAALNPSSATQFSYAEVLKLDVENGGTATGPAVRFRTGATSDHNAADYMFQVNGDGGGSSAHEYSFNWGYNKWYYVSGADGTKPIINLSYGGSSSAGQTQYGIINLVSTATAWDVYDGTHTGLSPTTYDNNVRINAGGDSYFNGGDVGINQSSPAALLHIKGSENSWDKHIRLENHDTTDYGAILVDNQGMKFRTFTNGHNFHFRDNDNATTLFIEDGGNVGIGTTSPSSKLDVVGNIEATTATFSGQMSSGSTSVGSYHIVSASDAITTDGDAINGSNTTYVRAEGNTYAFSSTHTLSGDLTNGSNVELFRFNVTGASYKKFQAGKMYVRIQDRATSGFFQETVTFGYTGSGTSPVLFSTTDRIDSALAGTNSNYDNEKATIYIEFDNTSGYIAVFFQNDTGSTISSGSDGTGKYWHARVSCELFELDAIVA